MNKGNLKKTDPCDAENDPCIGNFINPGVCHSDDAISFDCICESGYKAINENAKQHGCELEEQHGKIGIKFNQSIPVLFFTLLNSLRRSNSHSKLVSGYI